MLAGHAHETALLQRRIDTLELENRRLREVNSDLADGRYAALAAASSYAAELELARMAMGEAARAKRARAAAFRERAARAQAAGWRPG